MSCSVHDAVELEDRGVRTVGIHSHVFENSTVMHAQAYGRPDYDGAIFVEHPIAALSVEEAQARADAVIDRVIAALVAPQAR